VIPKIVVDIPVFPVGIKTVMEGGDSKVLWADVPNAGGFHQTSAYPGHPGNTVINGHRDIQGSVFRHLDRVEIGDEILVYVNEQVYEYTVTEKVVVPETFASPEQRVDNLRLIGNMPEERLTLITCTPVGLATHRLLVIAKPPDQLAPQMPEAGQSIQP
jgi:sortase A